MWWKQRSLAAETGNQSTSHVVDVSDEAMMSFRMKLITRLGTTHFVNPLKALLVIIKIIMPSLVVIKVVVIVILIMMMKTLTQTVLVIIVVCSEKADRIVVLARKCKKCIHNITQ